MSSMQPLEYVSRASRLDRILRELLHQTPGVEAAAVVSFDGLPMASALPAEMDEDRVAAMSAALLSLAERAAQGLGRGDLSQVYIEGDNGAVFLVSAQDEGVLIAVTAAGAKVGMMLYEVKLAANRVGEVLHGPAPLPAPLPSHVTRGYLDAQDSGSNGRYQASQEEPSSSELSHPEDSADVPAEAWTEAPTEPADETTYSELDYSSAEYSAPDYSAAEYSAAEYSAPEYEPVLADAGFADLASDDAPAEEVYAAHSPTDIATDIPTDIPTDTPTTGSDVPTTVAEYIDAAYAGTAAAALVDNEPATDYQYEQGAPEQVEAAAVESEFSEPVPAEPVYSEPSYYAESPAPVEPAAEPNGWSSYAPSSSVLPGQGSWS